MSVVRVKDGVLFSVIAPGGFRILSAIDQAAEQSNFDLTITSGTDGLHSGPNDPHHRGEAYDVRTHDISADQKQWLLLTIQELLGDKFYAFLEAPNTDNEHIHCQVARGTTYP